MNCVAQQNKLETPKEKDEVNKREVHECDVRTRDPDAMVVPSTPKPTFKAEVLVRVTTTITSSCEGNDPLKKWNFHNMKGILHICGCRIFQLFVVYYESLNRELVMNRETES